MIKEIKENLYKINIYCGGTHFVECDNLNELFEYITDYEVKGYIVSSVNEILNNGTTPRLAFKSNKEYKKILKNKLKELNK